MMTSETIEVPPGRQDTAGVSPCAPGARGAAHMSTARPAAGPGTGPVPDAVPGSDPGPARLPGRGRKARLAAELAAERHVVLELQRAILPLHDEPFRLPGLRAAVRYLPASAASRVGGDWYITAEMPGGHVLVAIGDVAGHGLAITGAPPARLVGWLNDLVRHVGPEHTASVMAGYFDPASRLLTWAQAGHPPPILIRGPDAWPLQQPEGILLGAGDRGYHVATQQLNVGDLLLLYSDGLVERRNQSIDDGLSTMVAAACGATDPDAVIGKVLGAMGNTATDDDTCLVALQVL